VTAVLPAEGRPRVRLVGKYLSRGEGVLTVQRRHWAVLLGPGTVLGIGVLAAVVLGAALPAILVSLAWAGPAAFFGWHFLEWWFARFVVTDRRFLLVTGLIIRRVAMMPLARVTDMSYLRSPLGRVLGYGEFVLESAGQEQALRDVTFVARPDWLYRETCDLLFGTSPSPPPPSGTR
jgi:membrane protein YdbS with pleckstrin-like domain